MTLPNHVTANGDLLEYGPLGYYKTPLLVPIERKWWDAKHEFDLGHRIFMVPAHIELMPEDYTNSLRFKYSYQRDNWWTSIGIQEEDAKKIKFLTPVWMQCALHASAQPGLNPRKNRSLGLVNWQSMKSFVFVPPEVQRKETVSPEQKKPYELCRSIFTGYLYYNHYTKKKSP